MFHATAYREMSDIVVGSEVWLLHHSGDCQ